MRTEVCRDAKLRLPKCFCRQALALSADNSYAPVSSPGPGPSIAAESWTAECGELPKEPRASLRARHWDLGLGIGFCTPGLLGAALAPAVFDFHNAGSMARLLAGLGLGLSLGAESWTADAPSWRGELARRAKVWPEASRLCGLGSGPGLVGLDSQGLQA